MWGMNRGGEIFKSSVNGVLFYSFFQYFTTSTPRRSRQQCMSTGQPKVWYCKFLFENTFFYCHGSIPSRSSRTLFMIYWLCSSRKPKVKWQLPDVPTEHPDSNDMSWLYSNRTPEVKWLCPTLPVLLSSQVKFLKQCIFAKHQNLPWKNINTRDQLCSKDSFVYNILYICKKKTHKKTLMNPSTKIAPHLMTFSLTLRVIFEQRFHCNCNIALTGMTQSY